MWGYRNLQGSMEGEMLQLVKDVKLTNYEETFNKQNSASERVDFVYNLLKKSPLFTKIVTESSPKKSNEMSVEQRTKGNDLYVRDKQFLEALGCYTQSIAYAEGGSSFLGLAYANRSSVLFAGKYYKECLEDIERAFQNNYPDHLKEKLLKRKRNAENLKAQQKPLNYYTPVTPLQNKNALIPAASDTVEIRKNEKYGRHIVATKNIKIGDIISVENSFAHMIHSECPPVHCHECLDLCYNLIPCEKCSDALYCSELCMKQAFNSHHKYECDFISLFQRHRLLFVRMVLKGLKQRETMDDTTLAGVYRSDRFKEIIELATNEDKKDYLNTCIHMAMVCVSYHVLMENSSFRNDFDVDKIHNDLKQLLYQAFMPPDEISHLNIFCALVCFRISYSTTEISRRRLVLKKNYLFDCDCKACVKKWPTLNDLPLGQHVPLWFEEKTTRNTFEDTESNRRLLDELLVEAVPIYNKLEKYEPCQNLLKMQDLFTEIYSYMGCKDLDF
ncbi:hypothetical protein NQ314_008713 [Rhamnusium bicolor]|uniref:MYND-type domain-containing protein n=1 Tax=Rhamnusium bicolor TaxID=1586634 RepID=A0AAV8Y9F1_9CUCU|nr:hypothetical protein NQ314_008713 [Rhamnusium bicolor]